MSAAAEMPVPDPVTLASLASLPCWVAWQQQLRKPDDKRPTKIPFDPKGPDSRKAKANDATTWGTRQQAQDRETRLAKPFGLGGVGIEFTTLDDGRSIAGVDLDACRDVASGEIAGWARIIIDGLATYAEISPSGTGAKAFFLYATADTMTIRTALGVGADGKLKHSRLWAIESDADHPPAIELHVSNRYFAVTDQILNGCTDEWREVPTADILRLIQVDGPAFLAAHGSSEAITDDIADAITAIQSRSGGKAKRSEIGNLDRSRSQAAFKVGGQARREGASYEGMCAAIRDNPDTANWYAEKGAGNGGRELRRIWEKTAPEPEWLQEAQRDREGEPRANLVNAMRALRAAPELYDLVAQDEMLRAPLLMRPVPGKLIQGGVHFHPRPLRDTDVTAAQEWLQLAGIERISKDAMHQAIALRAVERAFHPVRDYLNGLRWDGTKRLKAWLSTYLGAEQTDYTNGIGTMFLIAMVARVYDPGCKADYLLVLEGPQGARKSTACAILGGQWFSDSLPDLRNAGKDVSQHLNGKWLIEVAEMSAMDKADSNALKSFVTRAEERYRPSYGRQEVIEPRQCLFVGTTNKSTYLRDETGGRRFWPVKVGGVDTDLLRQDRDQLFAEAVHLYRKGVRWWPNAAFELEHIAPQQESRYEADAWEENVARYLAGFNPTTGLPAATPLKARRQVTIMEVAREALFVDTPKVGTGEQRRISSALERLGWIRGERSMTGRPWVRGHDA